MAPDAFLSLITNLMPSGRKSAGTIGEAPAFPYQKVPCAWLELHTFLGVQ